MELVRSVKSRPSFDTLRVAMGEKSWWSSSDRFPVDDVRWDEEYAVEPLAAEPFSRT